MKDLNQIYYINKHNEGNLPWKISDVIFALVALFVLAIIFVGALNYANIDVNMNLYFIIFQLLISFSTLTIVYLIITQKYNMSFKEALGISWHKTPSSVRIGLFITILIILMTSFISFTFSQFTEGKPQSPYMDVPAEKLRWMTLFAIFFAPVVEEIFFRGFMQPAIVKLSGPFFGILITALIFGVAHTQYLEYNAAIFSVTSIGLILGIARHYTNSVMPGIFAHFFNNFLAVVYMLT